MKSGYEELKEKRKDAPAYCAKVAYELFPDHKVEVMTSKTEELTNKLD